MSLTINPAFIREEINDGAIGEHYDNIVKQILAKAPTAYLNDIIDRVLDDPNHPVNTALDQLIIDVIDLLIHEVKTGTTPDPASLSAPTPAEPCDAWSPLFYDKE